MEWRRRFSIALLIFAIVGWPVSALTVAKNEPPVVLALSWIAIFLGALDAYYVTQAEEGTAANQPTSENEGTD